MRKALKYVLAPLVVALAMLSAPAGTLTAVAPADELQEVTERFNRFLESWLVKQDIGEALTFVRPRAEDIEYLRKEFKIAKDEPFDFDTWTQKALVMWFFGDHGMVNKFGHGDPKAPGYGKLPVDPAKVPGRKRWKTTGEAVELLQVMTIPEEPGRAAVFLQLRHVPRDSIVFELRKVDGTWYIVKFLWMAAN